MESHINESRDTELKEIRSQDLRKESAKSELMCDVYNQRNKSENSRSQDDIHENIEGNEEKLDSIKQFWRMC